MSAFIIDTEGTRLHDPDVIELAHVEISSLAPDQDCGEITVQRFHPRHAITPGAMAVHNIIMEDLLNSPTWSGTWFPPGGLDAGPHYLIGHNIDFDYQAIGSPPGISCICTLALSRFLYDKMDSHKLGAMVYEFLPADHARSYVANAHGAGADVGMTFLILGFLLDRLEKEGFLPENPTFEQLFQISEKARIPRRMTFGKWGPKDGALGLLYAEVAAKDPGYLQWILRQNDFDIYVVKAAKQALGIS